MTNQRIGGILLRIKRLLQAMVLLSVCVGAWSIYCRRVTRAAPQVYRSAQVDHVRFAKVIERFHIRSVINLRGAHWDKAWYVQERAAAETLGVTLWDVPFKAYEYPRAGQLQHLWDLLQEVPRPVWIHCAGGADRTGLASGMASILWGDGHNTWSAVVDSVSWWQHGAVYPSSVARQVYRRYQAWLQTEQREHSRQSFERWLMQEDE